VTARIRRAVYLALGILFAGIGLIGAFVPLLPTVPLLLLAVWCFARSSERLHAWLYHHPTYGKSIRNWDAHGVISRKAKIAACVAMAVSMGIMLIVTDLEPWLYLVIAATLTAVAIWMWRRPEAPPY
jgi:uncharacterized membrane protein YbaN (DUF454 family)